MNKIALVIAGPTAVGKTALAVELAERFRTSVISADSRQCFRELTIGVAKPSPEELAAVPHYFINSHSIHDDVTAATFENYALAKAAACFEETDLVVVSGGTGLYIKAFCEGMDAIPPVAPELRQRLQAHYEQQGLAWLQQQLAERDPMFAATGEMLNPHRMLRALEVVEGTGQSILSFRTGQRRERPFRCITVGLNLPRTLLHERINRRVVHMMEQGLEAEARALYPFRHLNALQTVGYQELFDYFDGMSTLPQAVESIEQHTRQYARRQLTWLRKQEGVAWFEPQETEAIYSYVVGEMS
ncbi:MAG TPA: tRNA (adenosine(37)-N6)-dimethylallyltransferase MiaA [Lacibacter sp.]|nr:tRNA (adenosine(37)-N6)-dimethylallyltransferase MiaA [Lacibacter sp.]